MAVDEMRKLDRIIIVMLELCYIKGQRVSNYLDRE